MQNKEPLDSLLEREAGLTRPAETQDFSTVGYFTLKSNGAITRSNLAGARLLGLERARIPGRRFSDFMAETDHPAFYAFLKQIFAAQAYLSCEARLVGDAGPLRSVHIEAALSENRQLCDVVVVDITKLGHLVNGLAHSEKRFRAIVEEAVDAFFQGDASGNFIRVNALSCSLTGYSSDELLAMNMRDLFSSEELSRTKLRYDLLKEGKMLTSERSLKRKDGTLVPIEMKSRLMSDGTYQSFFRDLTDRKQTELAIRTSETRLKRAELASKAGNWELHLDSQKILASEGAMKIYGTSQEQFNYPAIKSFPLAEYRPLLDAALKNLIENDTPYDVDFKIKAADTGEIKDIHSIAVFDRERNILFGIIQDISEQKRITESLIESEARLQLAASVFTHAREGIIITDAERRIVEVNDTFTRITGYTREEVLNRNPRFLKSGRQSAEFYTGMWRTLSEQGYWSGEVWNQRKNGEFFPELLTISIVRDADGVTRHYVALFSDLTTLKAHQQQLEHIAHYDTLTNLPNRFLLADRLHQAINRSQRRHRSVAVACLDLDGFKTINDRFGQKTGDELLTVISRRMHEELREGDTLARIGGDEFIAVLGDLEGTHDFEPVLARLLEVTAAPVSVGDEVLQISSSIGVTLYPHDGADAEQLIRHADQAMYLAKQAGKNRYHLFDVDQDTAVKSLRANLDEILLALKRGEFVLHYQPKVNMKTGMVIGAEALIRWQHPERGLLLPSAFLPNIEDHPISVNIGEWVINTALDQMVEWSNSGLILAVSVNVGARQLQVNDFVPRLNELLAAHPTLPSGQLEIEILESSALEDIPKISQLMLACREIGVSFALDDFGTGYSSLTYLRRLPAELLKIDQSFVRNMIVDPEDLAIVKGVIGLATAFHRQVIAEGVETVAHGESLLRMGCELAQGYGIARPMPGFEIPEWVSAWRPDASWTTGRQA